MLFEQVDNWATMAVICMLVSGSTYSYSVAALHQLSLDLATPNFAPTASQKVILEQALRHLDLELSFQAGEHPEFAVALNQWLDLNE